jgi:protein-tyrosine phosphatase
MYWIQNEHDIRLAIVPRPRGGDWLADELRVFRHAGIDVVVSLLTETEARELGLEHEQAACEAVGISFIGFPITDRGVPASQQSFNGLIERLEKDLLVGKSVGIHCRQSIGRSSLLTAALLCSFGSSADAAFAQIAQCRGCTVPDTEEQREWVRRFRDQKSI